MIRHASSDLSAQSPNTANPQQKSQSRKVNRIKRSDKPLIFIFELELDTPCQTMYTYICMFMGKRTKYSRFNAA